MLGILSFEMFHFYVQIISVYNGFNVHWVHECVQPNFIEYSYA